MAMTIPGSVEAAAAVMAAELRAINADLAEINTIVQECRATVSGPKNPRKVDDKKRRNMALLRDLGFSYERIGELEGVSGSTVRYWLKPGVREKDIERTRRRRQGNLT